MLALTVIVDALLVACLVVAVHCASLSLVNLGRDAWLEDYEKIARQNGAESALMQADSPFSSNRKFDKKETASAGGKKDDDDEEPRCPQVAVDSTLCSAAPPADLIQCLSDKDCASFSGRKCCHNGCRLACLVAVLPPPYIDWKYEPKDRFAPVEMGVGCQWKQNATISTILKKAAVFGRVRPMRPAMSDERSNRCALVRIMTNHEGNSWLIRGSDDESEVDWCSTSYVYDDSVDEEPLLCPHGYICRVDTDEHSDNAIPNRGRCIRKPPEPLSDEDKLFRLPDSRASDVMCVVSSNHVYSEGDTFTYGRHACKCEDGSVMCRVGKNSDVPLPLN